MFAGLIFVLSLVVGGGFGAEVPIIQQPIGIAGHFITTSVGIGTPPQFFDLALQLDTDKSIVVDSATQNLGIDADYDYIKQTLIPEISDTLNLTKQVCRKRYKDQGSNAQTYTADGHFIDDYVTLGGSVLAKPARFCDLDTIRDSQYTSNDKLKWLMDLPIDGFLGLSPGGENVLEKAMGMSQISLFIDSKASEVDSSGTITFGGQDTKNCKSFRTFPSEDNDSWKIWVSKASYNNKDVSGAYSTLLNLNTDRLALPNDIYKAITAYFGGSTTYLSCSGHDSLPDLQLTIYGKQYKLSIKSYITKMSSQPSYCQLSIDQTSSDDEDQIIVGRHILDNYCLFLDFAESDIGLAELQTSNN
jgi:hypothetical protein